MVVIGEYPITATQTTQKQLLSRVSTQSVVSYDEVIKTEQKRMIENCAVSDIDFEFVLDSSGSIGSHDWKVAVDSIAKYWIRDTIKPNGSPQCGNHIAIRRYSSDHFYDLDFNPTNDWMKNGFTDYTSYVFDIFENLPFQGRGTDTAGALEKVRIEDIHKARAGTKYVMVFTDGASQNFHDTVEQAQLLHPLVSDVFAYGIGSGRDPM